jgi:hypothetical protein
MKRYGPRFGFFSLLLAAAITIACGSSPNPSQDLQSISVMPTAADAQNYPNGQVQFTALGHYSSPGTSAGVPVTATWSSCNESGGSSPITVSSTGVAQCGEGASGTYVVEALIPMKGSTMCNAILACGDPGTDCLGTHGVAKLTCP